MGRTALRCNCGQRIGEREVLRAGYYPRPFGSNYVLVRYRCSRCRKRGEQFLKQEEWESRFLNDATLELDTDSLEHFDSQGPITVSEQACFHHQLETLGDLKDLAREFGSDTPES